MRAIVYTEYGSPEVLQFQVVDKPVSRDDEVLIKRYATHINEPITVLELAQASGSCVRTLEYVFREYFDVTPKAYLKSRRLVAVRNELLRSIHSKPSIIEVANHLSFWHMSQFASDYRRFFGELPSETVQST